MSSPKSTQFNHFEYHHCSNSIVSHVQFKEFRRLTSLLKSKPFSKFLCSRITHLPSIQVKTFLLLRMKVVLSNSDSGTNFGRCGRLRHWPSAILAEPMWRGGNGLSSFKKVQAFVQLTLQETWQNCTEISDSSVLLSLFDLTEALE